MESVMAKYKTEENKIYNSNAQPPQEVNERDSYSQIGVKD